MINFFIATDTIPRTSAQQKGVQVVHGRPMFYTKAKVQDAKRFYAICLKAHRPPGPIEGAIKLIVNFYYPVRKPHKNGEPKTTRPDTDNMIKLLKDVMTDVGFWVDDSQIVHETVTKSYSEPSGIQIRLVRLDKQGNEVIEDETLYNYPGI